MATSTGSVVHEALTKDNYSNWSTLMKNYLISKDLWDDIIVDSKTTAPKKEDSKNTAQKKEDSEKDSGPNTELHRKKRDAKALYIIQMSCGSENLSQIKETNTAKSAWNTLASLFGPRLRANPDIEQGLTSLHRDVQRGDWDTARSFMSRNPRTVYEISDLGRTVLHAAVLVGNVDIVKKLAREVPKRLLEERDKSGYTALALAADSTDTTEMAECMVKRSEALVNIKTNESFIPVELAAGKGYKEMTRYLYHKTPRYILKEGDGRAEASLLTRCITSEIFDVALELLQRNPRIPLTHKFDGVSPFYALAHKPSAFPSVSPPNFWQRWAYNCITYDKKGNVINIRLETNQGERRKCTITGYLPRLLGNVLEKFLNFLALQVFIRIPGIKPVYDIRLTHFRAVEILRCMADRIRDFDEVQLHDASAYEAILEASKSGIAEFITLMTWANPDLYWVVDENQRGIFSYAVLNRREKIFNLIHKLKGQGSVIISRRDIFDNNMLHFTGMLAPLSELDRRSGPALQMQRELQWFEALKEILHPKVQQDENKDGVKPRELFTKKHEELVKDGEKWAKETATSFTIVATLLTTIMFAAAFTVPGGNNQDTGIPIFVNERMFSVFILADALSLFASTTSVMIFIGILTSRYAERDFLRSLPLKLMSGLLALICAVLAMMVSFCAALSLMLRGHFQIVLIAISIASLSAIIFLSFQLGLLVEIFNSTFRSEILIK